MIVYCWRLLPVIAFVIVTADSLEYMCVCVCAFFLLSNFEGAHFGFLAILLTNNYILHTLNGKTIERFIFHGFNVVPIHGVGTCARAHTHTIHTLARRHRSSLFKYSKGNLAKLQNAKIDPKLETHRRWHLTSAK